MINFNNHKIFDIHYDGHHIQKAYGCDAHLVWEYFPRTWFKFKAVDTGTFKMSQKIEYSVDGGLTWSILDANTPSPTVQAGDYIYWRRNTQGGTRDIGTFSSTGRFEAEGNIMSLIVGKDCVDDGKYYGQRTFGGLFSGCTGLTSAENIILPDTVINGCYYAMFSGCTAMTSMPDLPATTMKKNCYNSMFTDCKSLTTAKKLPATTLADSCYHIMFWGCTSLASVPEDMLPATSVTYLCYGMMFRECSSLVKAPVFPATALTTYSYNAMFYGCSSLNEIKCLAINTGTSQCTTSWVDGVAPTGTFYKNKNMSSWTTGKNGIPVGWIVKNYSPTFEGKWLATYSDGSTASAECDASSAITQNEINKTNIVSVEIGDCVTTIGDSAFAYYKSLTSIDIPSAVTYIGEWAFTNCTSLSSITIPDSVARAGNYSFANSSGLTSVTIGSGITTIGDASFYNCSSLQTLTVNATTPPTIGIVTLYGTNILHIYVPAESVDAYKAANNWSSYADRIQPIP